MITSSKVHSQLAAAGVIIANLSQRLPQAVTNARLAALDPKSINDRPVAEDAGIRSKGGHSDPTCDQALSEIGYDERVFELFEANLDTLKLCLTNLLKFAEDWAAPPAVDHPLCNAGRDSVQEWARPDCNNLAAYQTYPDGRTVLRGDGLCDACRMKKHRYLKRIEEMA